MPDMSDDELSNSDELPDLIGESNSDYEESDKPEMVVNAISLQSSPSPSAIPNSPTPADESPDEPDMPDDLMEPFFE